MEKKIIKGIAKNNNLLQYAKSVDDSLKFLQTKIWDLPRAIIHNFF